MKENLQEMCLELLERMKRTCRRVKKHIYVCLVRFFRWKFGKWLAAGFIAVLLIGSVIGYSLGQHFANKKAKAVESRLHAKIEAYTVENEELAEQLKEAQIKNPEKRPWYLELVNDWHPMKEGYVPKLVDIGDDNRVDERIAEPLKAMIKDAEKAGVSLYVCSAYRSVERQKSLYNKYMGNEVSKGKSYWKALEETKKSTAYPGRSEHGMGLAVDIVSATHPSLDETQCDTPEAKWLEANCHKYGFILRYPVGKTDITGIIYEPWHYRYVGVEDATKIMESGLTLEEYLGEVD